MLPLRQLTTDFPALLWLDAASACVQVGWLLSGQTPTWATIEGESGTALFEGVQKLGIPVDRASAFIFCDGPGSILGVRCTSMAIRTWCALRSRPVFAYRSLELVANSLGDPGLTVIADARRERWHCSSIGQPLTRVSVSELPARIVTPAGFRAWSQTPAGLQTVPYSLGEMLPRIQESDLFRSTDAPDAFLHEDPTYAKWTPQIHRAP